MISGLSPGDLVHTGHYEFIVFHSIKLIGEDGCSVQGSPFKRMNGGLHYEKMLGIVVSCPGRKEKEYMEGQMFYVILPDIIGWTRDFNVQRILR